LITITIRGIHLAILAAFVGGIIVAGGAVLALGGGDDDNKPADQPELANLDVAPTSAPTAVPTNTPVPAPTVAPTSPPQMRTCAEIRAAGTYNSDEERAFFLANCTTQTASSGGSTPPTQSSSSPGATAEEQNYRTKAQANLTVIASKFEQFNNTPSYGAYQDILTWGIILRQFAQELDRLPTPPPRFKAVHDQLRSAMLRLADKILTLEANVSTLAIFQKWYNEFLDLAEAAQAALEDYSLVVGVELPPVFTE
jgi:hypothetical protein